MTDRTATDRREARQRANKARQNAKTCPASRHVHMIVDGLTNPKADLYQLLEREGYEPAHMASSISSVLADLWDARQFMEWERLPPTKRYPLANGRWVPINTPNAPTSSSQAVPITRRSASRAISTRPASTRSP